MRSGRSPLPLLLGVAFALWSPLPSVSGSSDESCSRFPTYHERCRFPKDHFFYNVTSKRCQRFRDYGCPMNVNSYRTLKKCQQFCAEIDVCQMPPEKGDCDNKRHRWFYDPSTKDCKTFTFGGCGGNLNNFNTGRECRLRCRNRGIPAAQGRRPPRSQWTLDAASKGAVGKPSAEEDVDERAPTTEESFECPDSPLLPADRSCSTFPDSSERCGEPKERFFCNVASKSCEPFVFYGCPGSHNSYSTIKQCQKYCEVAELPEEEEY
ncbi:carboxypeptidase inhibitor SmCI-like [Pituophis catenifer annectens]|uniref:carboxypeptidase inhibitor SmCI-like n=1 Tax=Pituophis catenifer annectens TaxID=94852 RepID=UPI003992FC0F